MYFDVYDSIIHEEENVKIVLQSVNLKMKYQTFKIKEKYFFSSGNFYVSTHQSIKFH